MQASWEGLRLLWLECVGSPAQAHLHHHGSLPFPVTRWLCFQGWKTRDWEEGCSPWGGSPTTRKESPDVCGLQGLPCLPHPGSLPAVPPCDPQTLDNATGVRASLEADGPSLPRAPAPPSAPSPARSLAMGVAYVCCLNSCAAAMRPRCSVYPQPEVSHLTSLSWACGLK